MISFEVENQQGEIQVIEIPSDINLNLMEVLKASEYPIEATCGGMALCATCHIEVCHGIDQIPDRNEQELDMLDTLPESSAQSRLACQIKISERLQGIKVKLAY